MIAPKITFTPREKCGSICDRCPMNTHDDVTFDGKVVWMRMDRVAQWNSSSFKNGFMVGMFVASVFAIFLWVIRSL